MNHIAVQSRIQRMNPYQFDVGLTKGHIALLYESTFVSPASNWYGFILCILHCTAVCVCAVCVSPMQWHGVNHIAVQYRTSRTNPFNRHQFDADVKLETDPYNKHEAPTRRRTKRANPLILCFAQGVLC